MNIEIWTDGTSRPKLLSKKNRGKDGPSAGSIIIKEKGEIVKQDSFYAGIVDNNQAEYIAFIKAVKYALELEPTHTTFYTDSNVIEKQMTFQYNAYKDSIIPYYNEAKSLLQQLNSWEIKLIPRKENRQADKLANDFMEQWENEIDKDI